MTDQITNLSKMQDSDLSRIIGFSTKASVIMLFLCIFVSAFFSGLVIYSLTFGSLYEDVGNYSPAQLSVFSISLQLALYFMTVFIGMAFACLGFAMFLIQARGTLSISATGNPKGTNDGASNIKGRLEASAPGIVMALCSTIIICLTITRGWNMDFSGHNNIPNNQGETNDIPAKQDVPPPSALTEIPILLPKNKSGDFSIDKERLSGEISYVTKKEKES